MTTAYFVEIYKSNKKEKLSEGSIQKINRLEFALKNTKNSSDLKTIAVFKIRPKSQEIADKYEWNLKRDA